MNEFKKKSAFNIQVLEGVDPMSDVSLAEIRGGIIGCPCKAGTLILKPCDCNKGSQTVLPPIKPNSALGCDEVQPYLSFE